MKYLRPSIIGAVSIIVLVYLLINIMTLIHRSIAKDITQRYDSDPVVSSLINRAMNLKSRTACIDLLNDKSDQGRRWGVACTSSWMIENGKDPELVELLKKARDDPSERVRNAAANVWEYESPLWK